MKKSIAVFIAILAISLSNVSVCYAGDVPEALLSEDKAQLYFGKVTAVTDTSVTIIPMINIKGDAVLNQEVTYKKGHMMGGGSEQIGKTYLVGYINEISLYYWVTDSTDPRILKIKNASAMDLRLQGYLNNGDFEKAEVERLRKMVASPSALPTDSATISPASSPVITDSLLQTNAGATEKPASGHLPIILSLAGALIVVAVLVYLIIRKKQNTPTE